MCEWCARTVFRDNDGRPVAMPLVFPSVGRPAQASFPLISERFDRLGVSVDARGRRCGWDPREDGDPCDTLPEWRVSFDFIAGHLCEAHRDRAASREGPGGVECWLRTIGVRVSTRFPLVRQPERCDFVPRSGQGHGCDRTACCAEVVYAAFDVCAIHLNVCTAALADARKRPPPQPEVRGWWWD